MPRVGATGAWRIAATRLPRALDKCSPPSPSETANPHPLSLRWQVFYTPRASIPDVAACSGAGEALLCFDSLKSLPTQLPHSFSAPETTSSSGAASAATPGIGTTASAAVPGAQLDMAALEAMAGWLRTQLGLTLFGFDVVLPSAERGTYLVIDVNYFPNYRGGEGGSAAVALRRALRQQWERLAAAQAAGGARAL